MDIKVELICPLGSKCEEIKGDVIKKCMWYQTLAGTNPNSGEQVDEKSCAIAWLPLLLIENSMQQRSTSAAVESFRNEMTSADQTSQQILLAQVQRGLLNGN